MLAELVFDVHEDVYNFEREKGNRTEQRVYFLYSLFLSALYSLTSVRHFKKKFVLVKSFEKTLTLFGACKGVPPPGHPRNAMVTCYP